MTKAERLSELTQRHHGIQIDRHVTASLRIRSCICFLAALVSLGAVEAREVVEPGDVVVIPLKGEISPSLALFLRRAVKEAESDGASAIILDMDTYGGRLDAAEKITGILNHTTIPTYTYINSNAGSAGALIALATQTHLHGAGERDRGGRAHPLDRRRSAADCKREDDFVLVRARPRHRYSATATIPISAKRS